MSAAIMTLAAMFFFHHRSRPAERPGSGLSGMAFQDWAEYQYGEHTLRLRYDKAGIEWMLANVSGTPTILEAVAPIYSWSSRFSIYTGLPTVIGWDWHQKQQKNAVGGQFVDERVGDVATIYSARDSERDAVLALLHKYNVEYIIVGDLEYAQYDAIGLRKFQLWAMDGIVELVYLNPGLRIFRLPPGAD